MKKYSILILGLCFVLCSCSKQISTLLDVAQSQAAAQRQLSAETKHFNNLKTALDEGRIKSGLSQRHIKRLVGSPVLIQQENGGERWVYKPSEATFFENNKIYLYFDKNRTLTKYKVFEPEEDSQ